MPPTGVIEKRGLRDSAWGKAALLAAVLLGAFVAAQSCASRDTEVSKEEAVEISRRKIDFEPEYVITRFTPRGIESRPSWAVSFSTRAADGDYERITVVVVDAETGEVLQVSKER